MRKYKEKAYDNEDKIVGKSYSEQTNWSHDIGPDPREPSEGDTGAPGKRGGGGSGSGGSTGAPGRRGGGGSRDDYLLKEY